MFEKQGDELLYSAFRFSGVKFPEKVSKSKHNAARIGVPFILD